jgi:hypothetical protein
MRLAITYCLLVAALGAIFGSAALDSSATHGGADVIGIDTDVTGNTATSLGNIEPCVQVNPGDTVTLDVFIQNVPLYNDGATPGVPNDDSGGIIGWQYLIEYNEANLSVGSQDVTVSLLNSNAGSSMFDVSDLVPDVDGNNTWLSTALDTGTGIPEGGSGILSRLTINVEPTAATGQYSLPLDLNNTATLDAPGAAFAPHSLAHGAIAVGQACGPIVTPPLTPAPTPLPTPGTPTPAPPTATPAGDDGRADVIGIDTDVTGNTATILGTINPCVQVNPGDTLTLDVFIQNVPPYNDNGTPTNPADDSGGIILWQYVIQYDEANLRVFLEDINISLVNSNAGSSMFSVSEPVPDADENNTWLSSALDIGTGIPEDGSGILSRLTINVEPGAASGQYNLILDANNTAHGDALGTAFAPHSLAHGAIAVGQACGPIVTPSPTPVVTPPPTPTPPPPTAPATFPPTPPQTATATPFRTATPTATATASPVFPTATPAPPPIPPGFHDARAARLQVPNSVDLSKSGTGRVTFTVVNDGNHFDSIGVYLDVIPPTDGNCFPAGRIVQTVLHLNPKDRVTLTVDGYPGDPTPGDGKVTFACSQPVLAQGQNYAFILAVDAHGDDLPFCPPNALLSPSCRTHLNDDDAVATHNIRIRTGPTVVIR